MKLSGHFLHQTRRNLQDGVRYAEPGRPDFDMKKRCRGTCLICIAGGMCRHRGFSIVSKMRLNPAGVNQMDYSLISHAAFFGLSKSKSATPPMPGGNWLHYICRSFATLFQNTCGKFELLRSLGRLIVWLFAHKNRNSLTTCTKFTRANSA